MINILDFADLRDTITQYIVENNYFSDYDIDTNDIVQMIIDIFSYITSTLSSSLVTAENNLLLYSSQDPDMIMNLLPLFGYSPNYGTPQQQNINMYLTQNQVNAIMQNSTIANIAQTAYQNNSSSYFVIIPSNNSINITSSVLNTSVTPNSNALQTLNWMVMNTVVLSQAKLYTAYLGNQTCQLQTLSGNLSIPILQQKQQTISFSNVQGMPFEKFLIEENIMAKSLIINFNELSTTTTSFNFNPSLMVSTSSSSEIYNVYSSIIDATGSSDNFILLYYDPVSNMLYIQAGDNSLNGNILPSGSNITLTYYETYGNTVVGTPGSLNSTISYNQTIMGSPFDLNIIIYQNENLYGGILYSSINDIKQQALILGNINNRLVTQRDYILYTNYYLTNFMPYQYSTCNVFSSFGENSIYVLPLVSTNYQLYTLTSLSQEQQNNLNTVLTNLSPMTTYIIVSQPTLYYLSTLPNTSINLTIVNNVSLQNIQNQLTQALDNYFNITTFDPFANFDVVDFTTILNTIPYVSQIDYNSITNSLVLETITGSAVSYVDTSASNSIIPLPSVQLNTYSISNSSYQAITLTSSQISFSLYIKNSLNQKTLFGTFTYPSIIN